MEIIEERRNTPMLRHMQEDIDCFSNLTLLCFSKVLVCLFMLFLYIWVFIYLFVFVLILGMTSSIFLQWTTLLEVREKSVWTLKSSLHMLDLRSKQICLPAPAMTKDFFFLLKANKYRKGNIIESKLVKHFFFSQSRSKGKTAFVVSSNQLIWIPGF